MTEWHIVTGEYPPQEGGVSDYTRSVARGLAEAGDRVDVWAPPANGGEENDPSVTVHRLPDRFGLRSLQMLSRELDRAAAPRRILVQYVPHSFGMKGGNVPFCLWLRTRRRDSVWVMFHEVTYPIERPLSPSRTALAIVNRVMASFAASSAKRAFVSIPAWRRSVEALARSGTPIEWLPVPSAIPVTTDPAGSAAIRASFAGERPLVGHFGGHGRLVTALLAESIPALTASVDCRVLLIGHGGREACRRLIERHPILAGRVHATGPLTREDVSRHIAACDLMLQPYPDGISTRRTSAMAALSHGMPLVTTSGWLTESLWESSNAVAIVPRDRPSDLAAAAERMLSSPDERARLSAAGRELYDAQFSLQHTIRALRGRAPSSDRHPALRHAS